MKTKQTILKAFASVALAMGAFASADAQTNLGAACGCPAVNNTARPVQNISTWAPFGYAAVSGTFGGELNGSNADLVLTCDKTWILDKKIYIPTGKTLTIVPGAVIKAAANSVPSEATALIIERGGKIMALGTESCPIVFTAEADPMDGTYAISNKGLWGGVVILGRAENNLTLANNGPFQAGGTGQLLAVANGLGTVEGFATSNTQDQYGVNLTAGESFNNDENSGIFKYVSIRHSGAISAVGAEINGLTLASVGRGTTIEHVEIVSCADDNIEIFGGTVNLKYISTLFGNDDIIDWDLGWTGKAQFLFGMKSDLTSSADSDNGFEMDSDDQKSDMTPFSRPTIYNATMIGNDKALKTADNSAIAGIQAKEFTGGAIYNSIFANFNVGMNLVKSLGSAASTGGIRDYTAGGEAWHNWTNIPGPASATTGNGTQSLKVVCNTFVGCLNPLYLNVAIATSGTSPSGGTAITSASTGASALDWTQFTVTDKNDVVVGNTLPGFDYTFTANTTTNAFTAKNDVTPNPALSVTGCPVAPFDGFFEVAQYRGAFSSTLGENWLSNWSYSQVLNSTKGVRACPTDINNDGVTNTADFLIFGPAFGTSCN